MLGRRGPQTFLKRQREQIKQKKRLDKLARRQQRLEEKRATKNATDQRPSEPEGKANRTPGQS